jgi:hypothetical protein
VVDYQKLNEWIELDITLLPHIEQIIQELGGNTLFTKINVHEGYHNIQIIPEDRWKTAFKTLRGLYQFCVMSFCLRNALATFSRFIAFVVDPIQKKYPKNFKHYMDDLIVTTKLSEEELHQQIIHELLDILEKNLLFLEPSKCEFEKAEVDFLGIHLGNGTISIDHLKISGIADWPTTLHTIKEV